jgi:hypothetical protein
MRHPTPARVAEMPIHGCIPLGHRHQLAQLFLSTHGAEALTVRIPLGSPFLLDAFVPKA